MQNIFDGIEVPKLELDTIVSENIQKIYRLHRMKRKRKVIIYCAATIALVITGAGICVANPVLASQIPLIGHLFEKVQDKAIYSGDYGKVAEPLKKDNVDESERLKVTLSEVYCNTEALNVSVLIESEAPFPEGVHAMDQAGENGEMISYVFMEARQTFDFMPDYVDDLPIQVNGTYLDNHTFAGSFRTPFDLGELSQV